MRTRRSSWRTVCLGAGLACACGAGCNAILGLGDPTVTVGDGGPDETSADGMTQSGDGASLFEAGDSGNTGSQDATLGSDASGSDTGVRDTSVGETSAGDVSTGDVSAGDTGGGDADSGKTPEGGSGDGGCDTGMCPIALIDVNAVYSPRLMAQDDLYVYWTDIDHGLVGRTPKGPGPSVTLWAPSIQPEGIAVDDAGVFWGDNAPGVWRCPRSDCDGGPTLVSSSGQWVSGVAVDDHNVYWTDMAVRTAPKDGVDAGYQTLWQSDAGATPLHIATDGQRVYFTADDGKLYVTNVDGGAVTSLGTANASGALGVALDNTTVYWTVSDPMAGTINFASKSTLAVNAALASSQKWPTDVASDGTSVYWVNFGSGASPDGEVLKCSISSCVAATRLARFQPDPRTILVDNTYVYWIDNGQTSGTLWKIAK